MKKMLLLLGGVGLGAGLMYLLDPEKGRRRRALLRDRAAHAVHQAQDALTTAGRDLANRAAGLVAEAKARAAQEPVADATLVERVRSRLGRCVRRVGLLEIAAEGGHVTLRGPVAAEEAPAALAGAAAVRDVASVEDHLQIQERQREPAGSRARSSNSGSSGRGLSWSPGLRLLASVAGATLAAYGTKQRPLSPAFWGRRAWP